MGEVYLAELVGTGSFRRRCAVKTVLPQRGAQGDLAAMFEREAVLAARIAHENVVQVFDFGQDGDTLYLVMEYIDGLSLRALAAPFLRRDIRMPLGAVCALVADAARGLAAIHELRDDAGHVVGVVHRDVTPDNILVTRGGLAKVGDFGIAVAADMARLTSTGEIKGKIPYMAPEQLDGGEVTSAADVFSLGVTLTYLLAGRRPFDRGTDLATMNAIVKDAPPPLRASRPDAPAAVDDLVTRMLAKDARARPSAREVADALAAVPGAQERPRSLIEEVLTTTTAEVRAARTGEGAPAVAASPVPPERELASATTTRVLPPTAATTPRRVAPAIAAGVALAGASLALLVWARDLGRDEPAPEAVATLPSPPATTPPSAAPPSATPPSPPPVAAPPAPPASALPPSVPSAPAAPVAAVALLPETAAPAPHDDTSKIVKPSAAPTRAGPLVELRGPRTVSWSTMDGHRLGSGNLKARVRGSSVVAVDGATGARCTVPVATGVAAFDALPTGALDVRANPYADVWVGARALGTTPIRPLPRLPACTYQVRLVYETTERMETVRIAAGGTTPLRVDME